MNSILTFTPRLVQTPGNHIRPKYDLSGLRRRLYASPSGASSSEDPLQLTPMIDMFSTLVIFLLLNFSVTGEIFFVSKEVVIPQARHVRNIESRPLISITPTSVSLDAEVVGHPPLGTEEPHWPLPKLVEGLRKLKSLQADLAQSGVVPKMEVNIQADQNVPVAHIKRVMSILIEEGFLHVHFAVRETD